MHPITIAKIFTKNDTSSLLVKSPNGPATKGMPTAIKNMPTNQKQPGLSRRVSCSGVEVIFMMILFPR
jgi:hypothetical protein